MGALAYELRRGDRPADQPRLFAVPGGIGVGVEPAPEPVAEAAVVSLPVVAFPPRPVPVAHPVDPAPAGRAADAAPARVGALTGRAVGVAPVARAGAPAAVRTLDDIVGGLFGTLAAGRQTACALCGGAVRPRPVAVGALAMGRCDGCGTHYEG